MFILLQVIFILLSTAAIFVYIATKLVGQIFLKFTASEYINYIDKNNVVTYSVVLFVIMLLCFPFLEYLSSKNFLGLKKDYKAGMQFYSQVFYFGLLMGAVFSASETIEARVVSIYYFVISAASFVSKKIWYSKNRRILANKKGYCANCGAKYDSLMLDCPECQKPYDTTNK